MLIKIAKIKYKEKVLNATKERQQVIYEGIPIRFSADFLAETLQVRREWHDTFKVRKWKNPTTKNSLPSKALIQIHQRNQNLYRKKTEN